MSIQSSFTFCQNSFHFKAITVWCKIITGIVNAIGKRDLPVFNSCQIQNIVLQLNTKAKGQFMHSQETS